MYKFQPIRPHKDFLALYKFLTLSFFLIMVSATESMAQAECEALIPAPSANVSESFKGQIEGQVSGLVSKFAGAEADILGEYRSFSQDNLQNYEDSHRLYVWQRTIYLACAKPELNIDLNKLLELYLTDPEATVFDQSRRDALDPVNAIWRSSPPIPIPQRGFDNFCPCIAIFDSPYDDLLVGKPDSRLAIRNDCSGNSSLLSTRDAGQRIKNPNFSDIPNSPLPGSGVTVTSSYTYERQEYAYMVLKPGQVGYIGGDPADYPGEAKIEPIVCGN